MDRRAWQATVHGVAKSRTQLGDFHFHSVGHLVIPQSQLCQKGQCLSLSAQWQALRPSGASPRWEGAGSQTSGGSWL